MCAATAPQALRWAQVVRAGADAVGVAVAWGAGAQPLAGDAADRQQSRDGCGAASLAVLLRRHGTHVPQRLLWSMTRVPGGGTRLGELARAAACFGHRAELGADPGLLHTPLPAIVHLRRGHFVVLESRDADSAIVLDPGCGRVRVPLADLQHRASGAILVLDAAAVDT